MESNTTAERTCRVQYIAVLTAALRTCRYLTLYMSCSRIVIAFEHGSLYAFDINSALLSALPFRGQIFAIFSNRFGEVACRPYSGHWSWHNVVFYRTDGYSFYCILEILVPVSSLTRVLKLGTFRAARISLMIDDFTGRPVSSR